MGPSRQPLKGVLGLVLGMAPWEQSSELKPVKQLRVLLRLTLSLVPFSKWNWCAQGRLHPVEEARAPDRVAHSLCLLPGLLRLGCRLRRLGLFQELGGLGLG